MAVELKQLMDMALIIRAEHNRCRELAEALRHETSWINMEAIGHQLQTHLESWRETLGAYERLSAEYEYALPDEVYILHNLNKMVDDYRHAR